jgi:uncharacterized protein DUF222
VRAASAAFPDDPAALSHERAAAGFAQLQRISELVEAKRLRWLANQERRASYRQDGYLSAAAWLANRFGVAAGSAKEQVRVASALEEIGVRRPFLEGEVTSSAVRVLAEARREHPDQFASGEEVLVEAASSRPADRAEILRARRRLDGCPTPTRMVRVEGELDPEGGEAVLTALQAMVDGDLRATGPTDLRTPAQRRADALCELARRYLDSPSAPPWPGNGPTSP